MTDIKEYQKEYYQKNKENIRESQKKYKKKNKEKKEEKIVICTACRSVDSMGMTHTKYPTIQEASKHTNLTVSTIKDSIENYKPAPDGFYYRWTNHEYV